MHNLEIVKNILEINSHEKDELIGNILENIECRLKVLLENIPEIPSELNYIVVEVAVSRFNRIGSEGYSSHNIEGENISLMDDDFAPYRDDIAEWLKAFKKTKDLKRGKIIFI